MVGKEATARFEGHIRVPQVGADMKTEKRSEMKRMHSVWHSLVRGLAWGLQIALLNGLGFPFMFRLSNYIGAILYRTEARGPTITAPVEHWLEFSILGLRFLSVPSVIGGCVLALIVHCIASRRFHRGRVSLWIGVLVGSAVALSGLVRFFLAERSDSWIFAVFVFILEVASYAWVGQRLAISYPLAESSAEEH